MGFKQVRGVSYYKVRWQGYGRDQDSWEPARNLVTCDSLIEEYHSRTDAVSKQRKVGGLLARSAYFARFMPWDPTMISPEYCS